jgi:hypothetical protein
MLPKNLLLAIQVTYIVYRPEILEISRSMIKDQEIDNVVLNKWLQTKCNGVSLKRQGFTIH